MSVGKIVSINTSEKKGTIKKPVSGIAHIDCKGIMGDAHSGSWHRQISLLSSERIEEFSREIGKNIKFGEFAENITTEGIDLKSVTLFDRFIAGSLILEVTQLGKKCHGEGCAIFREVGKCVMPHEGIFCRVVHPGSIRIGDQIKYLSIPLKISVITASDRASKGEYEDKSGPEVIKQIEQFFIDKPWKLAFKKLIVPDEYDQLENAIRDSVELSDVVFITGGTGIGPRDITSDIVEKIIDKEIPGIMDYIRNKYGESIPSALISRSIAGVTKSKLVYAIPGSVKAAREYVQEIMRTIEHCLFMLKGIDSH
ncbi:MAG TPA: molybdenum cofactor synthesis protein [Lentisphaeria bacterium]|nr:MAG: hypothetical protein A2X47_09855 [Lentisphaerae bacterium GWF2_38_69]HBM16639.1 molybdenum cofactor synthesis protein [Lentisphaeria bacterium]